MDFTLIWTIYSNISVIWPSVLWTSAYTDHFSRNKRGPCIRNWVYFNLSPSQAVLLWMRDRGSHLPEPPAWVVANTFALLFCSMGWVHTVVVRPTTGPHFSLLRFLNVYALITSQALCHAYCVTYLVKYLVGLVFGTLHNIPTPK